MITHGIQIVMHPRRKRENWNIMCKSTKERKAFVFITQQSRKTTPKQKLPHVQSKRTSNEYKLLYAKKLSSLEDIALCTIGNKASSILKSQLLTNPLHGSWGSGWGGYVGGSCHRGGVVGSCHDWNNSFIVRVLFFVFAFYWLSSSLPNRCLAFSGGLSLCGTFPLSPLLCQPLKRKDSILTDVFLIYFGTIRFGEVKRDTRVMMCRTKKMTIYIYISTEQEPNAKKSNREERVQYESERSKKKETPPQRKLAQRTTI